MKRAAWGVPLAAALALSLASCAPEALRSPAAPLPGQATPSATPLNREAPVPTATTSTPTPSPSSPAATTAPPASPGKPAAPKVNCRKVRCVALTFDDGPGAYTRKLLGYLKQKQARATFFMLGSLVVKRPAVVRAIAAAGNEIGVHAWGHPNLTALSPAGIDRELGDTANAIAAATGNRPTLMRPTYGAVSPKVLKAARKAGMAAILWNVDPQDWKTHDRALTIANVRTYARRNSIILQHDMQLASVEAVPAIIDLLRKRGFTLVTVTELLGKPVPGRSYRSGAR